MKKLYASALEFETALVEEALSRAGEMGHFAVTHSPTPTTLELHDDIVDSILNCMYSRGEISEDELIYTNRRSFDIEAHYAKLADSKGND